MSLIEAWHVVSGNSMVPYTISGTIVSLCRMLQCAIPKSFTIQGDFLDSSQNHPVYNTLKSTMWHSKVLHHTLLWTCITCTTIWPLNALLCTWPNSPVANELQDVSWTTQHLSDVNCQESFVANVRS